MADASPSSLELAARLIPARASRSSVIRTLPFGGVALGPPAPTTTTTRALITTASVGVRKSTTATKAPATSRTTARHKTTTTRSHESTTTTAKPQPKAAAPSKLRPWTPPTAAASTGGSEAGEATWYDSPDPAVCAHKSVPMGTVLTVTNIETGASTTCRVGDRGPYVDGRIIDLSREAFSQLAPLSDGVINVKIEW